jgi:hypothetical protein
MGQQKSHTHGTMYWADKEDRGNNGVGTHKVLIFYCLTMYYRT